MLHRFYYGTTPKFTQRNTRLFSRGKYECKLLLQRQDGMPVAVSQSKDPDFPVWKIEYGFSCMVFPTYEDAMDYCKDRFLDLDGKAV